METTLTIQQVAERTGLSIDTLRYYERIGLLEPVARTAAAIANAVYHATEVRIRDLPFTLDKLLS